MLVPCFPYPTIYKGYNEALTVFSVGNLFFTLIRTSAEFPNAITDPTNKKIIGTDISLLACSLKLVKLNPVYPNVRYICTPKYATARMALMTVSA